MKVSLHWGALVREPDGDVDLDLWLVAQVEQHPDDPDPEIIITDAQAANADTGADYALTDGQYEDLHACPKLRAAILRACGEQAHDMATDAAEARREMIWERAND